MIFKWVCITMSELHFRPMERADIGACSDLFCTVFSEPPWNEDVSPEEAQRYFENCFSLASFRGFVAESGGRIVGLAAGFLKPWRKGMEFYLDEFCVAPSFQGKGIGSRLLDEICTRLAEEGVFGAMLNTERAYPAYSFYLKNGFSDAGLSVLVREK